jgi:hypothetical protein
MKQRMPADHSSRLNGPAISLRNFFHSGTYKREIGHQSVGSFNAPLQVNCTHAISRRTFGGGFIRLTPQNKRSPLSSGSFGLASRYAPSTTFPSDVTPRRLSASSFVRPKGFQTSPSLVILVSQSSATPSTVSWCSFCEMTQVRVVRKRNESVHHTFCYHKIRMCVCVEMGVRGYQENIRLGTRGLDRERTKSECCKSARVCVRTYHGHFFCLFLLLLELLGFLGRHARFL